MQYDRLIIATGGRPNTTAIPGLAGEFQSAHWIVGEESAVEARESLRRLFDHPDPVVIGAAPGATETRTPHTGYLATTHRADGSSLEGNFFVRDATIKAHTTRVTVSRAEVNSMFREPRGNDKAGERTGEVGDLPIEDLFSFDEDRVDFMSAGSFPASDPPPPQSMIAPPEPHLEGQHDEAGKGGDRDHY